MSEVLAAIIDLRTLDRHPGASISSLISTTVNGECEQQTVNGEQFRPFN